MGFAPIVSSRDFISFFVSLILVSNLSIFTVLPSLTEIAFGLKPFVKRIFLWPAIGVPSYNILLRDSLCKNSAACSPTPETFSVGFKPIRYFSNSSTISSTMLSSKSLVLSSIRSKIKSSISSTALFLLASLLPTLYSLNLFSSASSTFLESLT